MDVQLQELIDRIKKDGVSSAEKSADEIVAAAEKKAAGIVDDAQKKADEIIRAAKTETKRMEKASEDAITQAGRNMIISFRESIVKELDGIIQSDTEKAYSNGLLATLIPETVKAWAQKADASELSVLLSEKDLKALQGTLTGSLKEEISKGLEIKIDKTLSAGFRIGVKNGKAFYDYSAESLTELLSDYLNPRVAALMKNAAEGTKE